MLSLSADTMQQGTLVSLLSVFACLSTSAVAADEPPMRSVPTGGFVVPATVGGDMAFRFLDSTGKPEPINVVVSAASSFGGFAGDNVTEVLTRAAGLSQYMTALNFSDECRGLHLSTPAYANVSSRTPEPLDLLYRENFGSFPDGTCLQSVIGGFHFRGWRQSLSGAWLLAASEEFNLTLKHDIVPDGYDRGRDEIARRALLGGKDAMGCMWPPAKVENLRGIVQADAGGASGAYNHGIGIDGVVKLITVGSPACPMLSSGNASATASALLPRSTIVPSATNVSSTSPRTSAGSTSLPNGVGRMENDLTYLLFSVLAIGIVCGL